MDIAIYGPNSYPPDSELSGGERYPPINSYTGDIEMVCPDTYPSDCDLSGG